MADLTVSRSAAFADVVTPAGHDPSKAAAPTTGDKTKPGNEPSKKPSR